MCDKLNEEAIDELMHLINEVKEVQTLMKEFSINYYSDSDLWNATSFADGHTGILHWDKEYIRNIDGIEDGESFTIGACVTTGHEHEYKGKYTIAPKELAEVQGKIVAQYIESVINSNYPKHFKLEYDEPYGLYDNCGWEEFIGIKATIYPSALQTSQDIEAKKIFEEIKTNYYRNIDTYSNLKNNSASGVYDDEVGEFHYCIDMMSSLIEPSMNEYRADFGVNRAYIEQVYKEIQHLEEIKEELENTYEDKVKIFLSDWNEGYQYGMALYCYIL